MSRDCWDYRVISKKDEQTGETWLGVYEVFYDADGRVWTCTEEPVAPFGETLDDLEQDMRLQAKALAQPVLRYGDIPEEGAVNPLDDAELWMEGE